MEGRAGKHFRWHRVARFVRVRHSDEYLILDVNGLVSAAGGFLGLFLGHCALSVLDSVCGFLKLQNWAT